jgi:hypothetical protein
VRMRATESLWQLRREVMQKARNLMAPAEGRLEA